MRHDAERKRILQKRSEANKQQQQQQRSMHCTCVHTWLPGEWTHTRRANDGAPACAHARANDRILQYVQLIDICYNLLPIIWEVDVIFFLICVYFLLLAEEIKKKQSWSRSIWSYHTNPAIYMLCLICGCNTRSRSPSLQLVSSFISSPFSDETMNVNKIFKYVYDIPFALNFRDYVIISILNFQMTFISNKNVITSFCVCVLAN